MADYSVTAANVVASTSGTTQGSGIAGAAITAGQVLYLDPATNTYKLAKSNVAAPVNNPAGIALNGASIGQPVTFAIADPVFAPGFTVAAGQVVILSGAVAGNVAPVADNASGWFNSVLGIGIGSNEIILSIVRAGVAT